MASKVNKSKMACNKPKRTTGHKTKSHIVKACANGKEKIIRFGQQGVSGAGKNPKSKKDKARKKSFRARHSKNIAKGKMSAAYWANKVKWQIMKKKKKSPCWKGYEMIGMKKKKGRKVPNCVPRKRKK